MQSTTQTRPWSRSAGRRILGRVHPAVPSHDVCTAGISVGLSICRCPEEAFSLWSLRAAFGATPYCASGRSLSSAFAGDVLAPSARRTGRLDCIVHDLGLALGGRPAASFARRLMLPVSNDTLLRVVRRRARMPTEPLNVIGIDDWAWRRNHRYGTIVCDLERRRPVSLLPDREPATAAAWLERHQGISVVARDRGGGYGDAVARALPHATQVADRWHLMENASRAFSLQCAKRARTRRRPDRRSNASQTASMSRHRDAASAQRKIGASFVDMGGAGWSNGSSPGFKWQRRILADRNFSDRRTIPQLSQ